MRFNLKLKRILTAVVTAFLIFIIPIIMTPLAHGYEVNETTINCADIDPALCPTSHINEDWPVSVVENIVKWLMYAAGLVSIIFIIIGGLRYILASGDEKKLAGAKKMIIGSLIGLGIVVLSLTIISLVKYALGVS